MARWRRYRGEISDSKSPFCNAILSTFQNDEFWEFARLLSMTNGVKLLRAHILSLKYVHPSLATLLYLLMIGIWGRSGSQTAKITFFLFLGPKSRILDLPSFGRRISHP